MLLAITMLMVLVIDLLWVTIIILVDETLIVVIVIQVFKFTSHQQIKKCLTL